MNINHIPVGFNTVIGQAFTPTADIMESNEPTFADIFTKAVENTSSTDHADKSSGLDLLTGTADDLSGVLIDSTKAEIALQLTTEIRDKVISAYDKILMMSV